MQSFKQFDVQIWKSQYYKKIIDGKNEKIMKER